MSVLSLDVAGNAFEVITVTGATGLSRLFRFDVEALIEADPPAATDLLGQRFTLSFVDGFERTLEVHGLVTEVGRAPGALGGATFSLVLEPDVASLGIGQNSRIFQEMTAVDIIKKVLAAEAPGAEITWKTTGTYRKRAYCAQHREADWAFLERLLAEEGIYYTFELAEGKTTLIFADDSTTSPDLDGGAEMPHRDAAALRTTRDSVTRVEAALSVVTDAVRLRDYNFEKPRLSLDAKSGSGPREVYDFPGRFEVPADGDHLAKVRVETLRSRRAVTSGASASTRLRAGLVFEITEHPVNCVNGRYLLDTVAYSVARGRGVEITWSAIPVATPFRAPARETTRGPGGPETGAVVGAPGEEIHPDGKGRIRVQLYWDREGKKDDKASTWMRVGQFALGGSMVLPRIGWDVVVGHHEGDIDGPYVASHLYDGQFPVPYALPANKTRTAWQTATTPRGGSTNEVRFEDKKGGEEIFINASKDMNVVIGDNKTEKVGVDHTHKIGANLDVKIGSNYAIKIKSKQDVSIGASETMTISGNRTVGVKGAESSSVGGSRSVTAIKGSTIDAKAGRTLTVGGSMMAVSALGVNRMALGSMSITVGGAWISAAATGLANMTGGAAAETVGGAKIHIGAAGCETSVKGAAAETVGGAYVIAAGGNAGESSTGALAITVGGAFLANAPTIEIEGESEISIRCGGATITIKSGSVEVKAPTLASPAATIVKKSPVIHHN
jgi:type VI secretion system secreted protein VgrG